jgi:hypothetical protein
VCRQFVPMLLKRERIGVVHREVQRSSKGRPKECEGMLPAELSIREARRLGGILGGHQESMLASESRKRRRRSTLIGAVPSNQGAVRANERAAEVEAERALLEDVQLGIEIADATPSLSQRGGAWIDP